MNSEGAGQEQDEAQAAHSEIYCWGNNTYGQLGSENKDYDEYLRIPKFVRYPTSIAQISCGSEHSALRTSEGQLYTMGSNSFGQLGLGGKVTARFYPTLVRGALANEQVQEIVCGSYHMIVCSEGGKKLFAWGRNDHGQAGSPNSEKVAQPTDITYHFVPKNLHSKTFAGLAAGKMHSGLVLGNGKAFTWGGNELGQLGTPDIKSSTHIPQQVTELESRVSQISCGYNQTIFLLETSRLFVCGNNDIGQLGVDEEVEIVDVPIPVKDLSEPIAYVCCSNFNVALSTRQNLYIWGDTPNGMLRKPEKLSGLAEMIKWATVGEDFICVLDQNNYVYSWGRNESGQLGLGDTEGQKVACSIDALNDRDVETLQAGKNFVLALGRGAVLKKDNPLLERFSGGTGTPDEEALLATTIQQANTHITGQQPEIQSGDEEGQEYEEEHYGGEEEVFGEEEVEQIHDQATERSREEPTNESQEAKEYQLPKSILEVYKHQRVEEAIYPIKDIEKMQSENKSLRSLVCAYEFLRQQLITVLENLSSRTPSILDQLDPRDIQKIIQKENFIEQGLFGLKFNLAAAMRELGMEDRLNNHKVESLPDNYKLSNPVGFEAIRESLTSSVRNVQELGRKESSKENPLKYPQFGRKPSKEMEESKDSAPSKEVTSERNIWRRERPLRTNLEKKHTEEYLSYKQTQEARQTIHRESQTKEADTSGQPAGNGFGYRQYPRTNRVELAKPREYTSEQQTAVRETESRLERNTRLARKYEPELAETVEDRPKPLHGERSRLNRFGTPEETENRTQSFVERERPLSRDYRSTMPDRREPSDHATAGAARERSWERETITYSQNAARRPQRTSTAGTTEYKGFSDPELYYLYTRLEQNRSAIQDRIQEISHRAPGLPGPKRETPLESRGSSRPRRLYH